MSMTIISLILIAVIVAVFLLGNVNNKKESSHEAFISKFNNFVKGKIVPVENYENSFRVEFDFEGRSFNLEDLEMAGFSEKSRKVHINHPTGTNFTLMLSEKKRGGRVQSDIMMVSKLPKNIKANSSKLRIPKQLKNFSIHTNDPTTANKLFDDDKILGIYSEFRNSDPRGRPFHSLKILDGVISLHFHNQTGYKPNYYSLKNELAMLEGILDKLIVISDKLK